jgi:hypothetical protein
MSPNACLGLRASSSASLKGGYFTRDCGKDSPTAYETKQLPAQYVEWTVCDVRKHDGIGGSHTARRSPRGKRGPHRSLPTAQVSWPSDSQVRIEQK